MIQIEGTTQFQCAADKNGWAFIWDYSEKTSNPCICWKYVRGKPTITKRELPSRTFWPIAGQIIRGRDWKRWNEKGLDK